MAEDIHHHTVVVFFLIDLVGQKTDELFLLGIQQDSVDDPAADNQPVEWPGNKIRDPHFISLLHLV